MNKAYKFRMYPNNEQKVMFAKTFGCVRYVYNHWLDRKISLYNDCKKSLSYTECAKELKELKSKNDCAFLKGIDSISLQQALRHLDTAFQNFFKRPKVGFPRFKSKKHNYNSYSTVCVNGNISVSDGYIRLPKVGAVKIKQHRNIPADYVLKSATISQTPSGKYYVSILFEYESQISQTDVSESIGLDFSMKELYVDDKGYEPAYPHYHRKAEKKLKRECRKLLLMQKGSNNRNKQRLKVAKLHERVSNQRRDFLHKQSRQIANTYDLVCIEDLDMKGMSQALNFGKSVADNGWGMFTSFLRYKLADMGKQLVKVDKFFASSQTCSVCGKRYEGTKDLSVREWDCPACGAHHDRDMNAAINIRNEGLRMLYA